VHFAAPRLQRRGVDGVRTTFAATTAHVFPCGPLDAIPTKWFRFTVNKSNASVELDAPAAEGALVLAVYSSSACGEASLVGCSFDKNRPSVDVTDSTGKTFFAAVGAASPVASSAATLRADR